MYIYYICIYLYYCYSTGKFNGGNINDFEVSHQSFQMIQIPFCETLLIKCNFPNTGPLIYYAVKLHISISLLASLQISFPARGKAYRRMMDGRYTDRVIWLDVIR